MGHLIPFSSPPPLSPVPLPSYSLDSIKGNALHGEILSLLEKGVVELAPPSPGYCSRLGGIGLLEARNRSFRLELLHSSNSFQDGDQPVGSSCSSEGRLDGLHRLEGYLPSGPCPSRQPAVSSVCRIWESVPIQSFVLVSPQPLKCLPGSWLLYWLCSMTSVSGSSGTWTTG